MKKTLLSLAVACSSLGVANAQLAIGSVAPDFTLTDINGVSQNLYTYLNQGYTVLIDISAAWCGPCWSAHSSGFMKNLYNQYGPSGTVTAGKVMVIFVEGESTNTTAQLYGTSTGTTYATYSQGDWVTDEPYVFIDNAGLNSSYQVSGFPTFTVVCPNRQVVYSVAGYGSAMSSTSFWMNYINTCPVAVTGTNVGTIGVNTPTSVCAGGTTTLSARIQNLGTTTLTSATVTAKVAGSAVASTTWTGSLAQYDYADVAIGTYTFADPSTVVTYEATTTNDAQASDDSLTLTSNALSSSYKSWILEVKTDQYPGEISWAVINSSGTTVYSHTYTAGTGTAGAGGEDAGVVFEHRLDLDENECYTIEITDDYGDGLYGVSAAADTGYIKLRDGDGVVYNFGGGYESGVSKIVKTGTSALGIEQLVVNGDVQLFPNPAKNELKVKLDMVKGSKVDFTVTNLLGQQVTAAQSVNLNSGISVSTVNTAALSNGVYFLNIATDEGKITRKFVKQ
ncbi:MAG: T9SS type A sorting domain-containing protein [Edaphocola sp.]